MQTNNWLLVKKSFDVCLAAKHWERAEICTFYNSTIGDHLLRSRLHKNAYELMYVDNIVFARDRTCISHAHFY